MSRKGPDKQRQAGNTLGQQTPLHPSSSARGAVPNNFGASEVYYMQSPQQDRGPVYAAGAGPSSPMPTLGFSPSSYHVPQDRGVHELWSNIDYK